MLFSKQCVRHIAPLFFCFVCWMITIPYTVDFHESKSSMTACFFSFIPVVVAKSFQKHRLTRGLFFFFNFGDFTFTQEGMHLALNTNVKCTWVNLSRFLSPFLLSPRLPESECRTQWARKKASGWSAVFWAFSLPAFCQPKGRLHFGMCSDPRFSSLLPLSFVCFAHQFLFLIHHAEETLVECRRTRRGKA